MNSPFVAATMMALCSILALVGMLLTSGVWDVIFFIIALLPLAWGLMSAKQKS